MDERFPKYIRWTVKKLDFIGLPNIGFFVAAMVGLGFIGKFLLNIPMENFVFNPEAVMAGEYWRIFAFPIFSGGGFFSGPFWSLFYIMYVYIVMNSIESAWGPGPLTIFTLFSYISALLGAFFLGEPIDVWFYVIQNISLAFGTLFPDMEFLFMFVIPVKAKWLAMLAGGLILIQFVVRDVEYKGFLLIVLAPYLLFFGPMLVKFIRDRYRVNKNRRRFNGE